MNFISGRKQLFVCGAKGEGVSVFLLYKLKAASKVPPACFNPISVYKYTKINRIQEVSLLSFKHMQVY